MSTGEETGTYVGSDLYWVTVVEDLLKGYGLDVDKDENLSGTPKRWLGYLKSYLQPYSPLEDLRTAFTPAKEASKHVGQVLYAHGIVLQSGIPYRAMCAHHLLPVLGTAHVAYIPNRKVVGLSKLTRLVYGLSHRRPSLQEEVCNEVVDNLMYHLSALGAMCVITAEHGCMAARGVEEPTGQVKTVTACVRGVFIDKPEARAEVYSLIEQHR